MAQTGRYTVRRGDTLSSIALRQKRSIDALAQANGITDPNRIFVGQLLTIPDAGSAPSASGTRVAVVRAGDTLTKIAARTGVPIATLIAANGLVSPYYVCRRRPAAVGSATPPRRQHLPSGCSAVEGDVHERLGLLPRRHGLPSRQRHHGQTGHEDRRPGERNRHAGRRHDRRQLPTLSKLDETSYYVAHIKILLHFGKVKAGDVLGTVGNTGDADGGPTHLHFEIHPAGGAAINPYGFLIAACR